MRKGITCCVVLCEERKGKQREWTGLVKEGREEGGEVTTQGNRS